LYHTVQQLFALVLLDLFVLGGSFSSTLAPYTQWRVQFECKQYQHT